MVYRATLKKPWTSPRGRFYPPGTIFTFRRRLKDISSTIYYFIIPGQNFGFVVLSDNIFKQLTKEEKHIRVLREKQREEHIKKTVPLARVTSTNFSVIKDYL